MSGTITPYKLITGILLVGVAGLMIRQLIARIR
jgi:hypothetical protein